MYAVTGSTGQLGRLVIAALLKTVPAGQIVALARDPAKAADLASQGVAVRAFDYTRPETLGAALNGVRKLLLISSSELGQRATQHRAVIDAAKAAGVELIAYTSVLHADRSPLGLAEEHRQTEAAIEASGVPFVVLRNGWYTENYAPGLKPALEHGVLLGAADTGRVAAASRQDYAEAAVAVLTREGQAGQVYELAGDTAFTLPDLAQEIARQAGKPLAYRNLPQAEYEAALKQAGLPPPFAALLADSDAGIAKGALDDDGHALSRLIGRPTTQLSETISAVLKA